MGVDLLAATGAEFDMNNAGWRCLTALAAAHGFAWPVDARGEEAEALDSAVASDLADAVERALGTGTDDQIAEFVSRELTALLVTPGGAPTFPDDPIVIRPATIAHWRQFVEFARISGGFTVAW